MSYAVLFAISFCLVSIKAFQQLNVVHSRYIYIIPISYAFMAMEVLLINKVVNYDNFWLTVLAAGTGGGLGCILSMRIDQRIRG